MQTNQIKPVKTTYYSRFHCNSFPELSLHYSLVVQDFRSRKFEISFEHRLHMLQDSRKTRSTVPKSGKPTKLPYCDSLNYTKHCKRIFVREHKTASSQSYIARKMTRDTVNCSN